MSLALKKSIIKELVLERSKEDYIKTILLFNKEIEK